MIKYGINNIRELVGHKVNLQMVYDSSVIDDQDFKKKIPYILEVILTESKRA